MFSTNFLSCLIESFPQLEEIKKIQYSKKDNSLFLDCLFNNEIDIKKLESFILGEIGDLNLIINPAYIDLELDYEKILKTYLTKECPSLLSHIDIIFTDKTLIIETESTTYVDFIDRNKIKSKIIKFFKDKYNFDIDVTIKSLESESSIDNILQERRSKEDELQKKVLLQKPIKKANKIEETESLQIGKKIKDQPSLIGDLNQDSYFVTIEGEIYGIESRPIRNEKFIVSFYIKDDSSATSCKAFWSKELYDRFSSSAKNGDYFKVSGKYAMDTYDNCYVITITSLEKVFKEEKKDKAKEKRVELRCHTQMSDLEGFIPLKELYKTLDSWEHQAIAITDKNVVQAFPEAKSLSEKFNIKTIYGMDADISIDYIPIVMNSKDDEEFDTFIVYDIETTGLAQNYDSITEIGAVKIKDGKIIGRFGELVKPKISISDKIQELTGITNEMVANQDSIDLVLTRFIDFVGDGCLVAHNAEFDIGFLKYNSKLLNLDFNFPYIDTLYLGRFLFPNLKNHRLNTLAKEFGVRLENHHRAVDDAEATAEIFLLMLNQLREKNLKINSRLNYEDSSWPKTASVSNNALILAKNKKGLKNLYKLVSKAHTDNLYRGPKILQSDLDELREGILLGSGNIYGELFQGIKNHLPKNDLIKIGKKFDFFEVQPKENYCHLIENSDDRMGFSSFNEIENINKSIIMLGEELGVPVVATGDAYYFNKGEHIYKDIVQSFQFRRKTSGSKGQFLRTTEEMLESLEYLGKEKAYEIVVENTNYIASLVEENVLPIPEGKYAPVIEGSEDELRNICFNKAKSIYGDKLPDIVENRLNTELESIISNGYSVLYIIARELVLQANKDGYEVGSRGSVGSSFAATMAGITEVNPLPPHYVCPSCKESVFILDNTYSSGVDMPDKECSCGKSYTKDGHNIPFEVFLGFDGSKEPDIDLNFAGEYQAKCHKYVEELFGVENVFRAGTIGTLQENTAFGYIMKYYEDSNEFINPAEIAYLQKGIEGCKRTTGQHPGGIMIIPKGYDVEDFSPINYPANDPKSNVITTHFTYKSLEETILKLDLLGHDVPTIYKMLYEMTGVNPMDIPMDDKKTLSLFNSRESLQIETDDPDIDGVGTLGVPEFGTNFVMNMLRDTRPNSIGELVRISGLSHGTDVWTNNAQDLVKEGRAILKELICTRDDIMTFLISKGMDNNLAFKTMESVRKGRGLTDEMESTMKVLDLPEWYIDSCKKIQYMFPKAHAVAYVLSSYRIAYYKVYYPNCFYASYFNTKINDFQESALYGIDSTRKEIEKIKNQEGKLTASDDSKLNVLQVAEEMYLRGYSLEQVNFNNATSHKFWGVDDKKILSPYCALAGVSEQASRSIYEENKKGKFISIEDLRKRTGINKTAIESLRDASCLDGLQETNQVDLFDFFD